MSSACEVQKGSADARKRRDAAGVCLNSALTLQPLVQSHGIGYTSTESVRASDIIDTDEECLAFT